MNTDVIKKFMSRVRGANASKSPDVRISTEEANELVTALGELLAGHVGKLQGTPDIVQVSMDGGSLARRP